MVAGKVLERQRPLSFFVELQGGRVVRSHVDNLRPYSVHIEDTETDGAIEDDHFEIECPTAANEDTPEVLPPQPQPHSELDLQEGENHLTITTKLINIECKQAS